MAKMEKAQDESLSMYFIGFPCVLQKAIMFFFQGNGISCPVKLHWSEWIDFSMHCKDKDKHEDIY